MTNEFPTPKEVLQYLTNSVADGDHFILFVITPTGIVPHSSMPIADTRMTMDAITAKWKATKSATQKGH